jgi:hypothetical protein
MSNFVVFSKHTGYGASLPTLLKPYCGSLP